MDRIIAIGGSAGAIGAIKTLCNSLPADIPAAVCIAVHVGARGKNVIADIFDDRCSIPVTTAVDGERLPQGHAYVAAADHHLIVLDDTIRLAEGRGKISRPSIDPLLRSVGLSHGSRAIGVILTGMLNDGAAGLADLKRCGGVTVVQNPVEAKEREMPLAALAASDIDYQTPIAELGALLKVLATAPPAPSPPLPDDIRLEVEIALGRPIGSRSGIDLLGDPVGLSCPGCGGVLSQMKSAPPLRFRCQVGHGYTGETLAAEQEFRRRGDARRASNCRRARGPHAEDGRRSATERNAAFRRFL